MEATQIISDSILESDEEDNEDKSQTNRGQPLAKLCILNNKHVPATELPLFLGDNVLGRDPSVCTLPLLAPSVSKQHATICISLHGKKGGRHRKVEMEALVWDLESMNGTRKGRLKLTPHVRYALSEGDSLVVADIPCQYISCGVEADSLRSPVSTCSSADSRLLDVFTEKGRKSIAGREKCINGASVKDTRATVTQNICLSFEETPAKPHHTLVPESDSDSDGERTAHRRKAMISDSDSHKSSPTCSTFLSPTNKVVPESEDESPITPCSSAQDKPYRHVSFSQDELDVDVGRQQLRDKEALTVVDDSEDESGKEEEGAEPGGPAMKESGLRSPQSLPGDEVMPAIPAFDINSDTDVEADDEGGASVGHLKDGQPSEPALFHMDSDTDVEEGDAVDKGAPSALSPGASVQPPPAAAVPPVQPEGVTLDSDTDVDEDADVSETVADARPQSSPCARSADSASSMQRAEFHLDSDTDVDDEEEEEERECGPDESCSKADESPSKLDLKSNVVSDPVLHMDSDTDDEGNPPPAFSEPRLTAAAPPSCGATDNSDTDVEENSPDAPVPLSSSAAHTATSGAPQSDSDADTDVEESSVPPAGVRQVPAEQAHRDPDVDDTEGGPEEAGERRSSCLRREVTPGLLSPLLQNCSTPVPVSEGGVEEMETQAFLSPSQGPFKRALRCAAVRPGPPSSCSDSPDDEDFVVAETQPFVLQSRVSRSDLGDDGVDSTQAFELESSGDEKEGRGSRGGSFQLGLSDSSLLLCQAQGLATESTQAFVSISVGGGVEETQAYADREGLGDGSNPEATQAYGGDGDAATLPEREGRVYLALQDTQAYTAGSDSDSGDEKKMCSTAETQPFTFPTSPALATAETQPPFAFGQQESSAADGRQQGTDGKPDDPEAGGEHEEPTEAQRPLGVSTSTAANQQTWSSESEGLIPGQQRRKEETEPADVAVDETQPGAASGDDNTASQPREGEGPVNSVSPTSETQPTGTRDNEEPVDDDSTPSTGKTNAKTRKALVQPEFSVAATQPMDPCEDEDSSDGDGDDDDVVPGRQRRPVKPLHVDEEQTQELVHPEISISPTQPMDPCEDEDSSDGDDDDDDDVVPVPQRRRAKPLQFEESQSLAGSVESPSHPLRDATCNMAPCEDGGSDDDLMPGPRKRKAKQLRLEEEETQPVDAGEDEDVSDADLVPGPRKRKAKPLQFEEESQSLAAVQSGEVERVEQDPALAHGATTENPQQRREEQTESGTNAEVETKTGNTKESEAGSSGVSDVPRRQEEKEQEFKRKTRGNRGKARPAEEEEEQQRKRKRPARQQKDGGSRDMDMEEMAREEKDQLEREEEEKQRQRSAEEQEGQEREREKLEKERVEAAQKEQEERQEREREKLEKERVEAAQKEQEERQERERREQEGRERERLEKEKEAEVNPPKVPVRGRRAARRTTTTTTRSELELGDVPARRTRSRSNSSNSISSERSVSSVSTQGSRGTGRGARTPAPRSSRRRTVAAEPSRLTASEEQETEIGRSKPLSSSVSSQSRRGGRGRKAEPESDAVSQEDQSSSPAPTPRGRKSRKADVSVSPGAPSAAATRGRRRTKVTEPEPADQHLPKRITRGRGPRTVKSENIEQPVASAADTREETKDQQRGRKRELEGEEGGKEENSAPSQGKRRGRASSALGRKSARGARPEVNEEETGDNGASVHDADEHTETSEPRTPTTGSSRKRQTPRSSSSSPAASVRQVYKVLFTGVVDEAGEKVLTRLGGSMATGVADMNCLVADKVRRTVKFLCAVAKGIPIVTPQWLEKSGKAGSFLSPDAFIVTDSEQEKKFNFCLQESLRVASSQPLLQGYEVHITKSVKPEPVHMKDIITCGGATILTKMPSSYKPQTVVISCEDDWSICSPALSASLPVVSAEFVLSGFLQQKLDFQTHKLSGSPANPQSAGSRGRGRKKT